MLNIHDVPFINVDKVETAVLACHDDIKTMPSNIRVAVEQIVDARAEVMENQFVEILNGTMQSLMKFIESQNQETLRAMKDQIASQSAMVAYNQRQTLSLFPPQPSLNNERNDKNDDEPRPISDSLTEYLGDMHPALKIDNIEKLKQFEQKIQNIDVANLYVIITDVHLIILFYIY